MKNGLAAILAQEESVEGDRATVKKPTLGRLKQETSIKDGVLHPFLWPIA